jgi:hypothetical protein
MRWQWINLSRCTYVTSKREKWLGYKYILLNDEFHQLPWQRAIAVIAWSLKSLKNQDTVRSMKDSTDGRFDQWRFDQWKIQFMEDSIYGRFDLGQIKIWLIEYSIKWRFDQMKIRSNEDSIKWRFDQMKIRSNEDSINLFRTQPRKQAVSHWLVEKREKMNGSTGFTEND